MEPAQLDNGPSGRCPLCGAPMFGWLRAHAADPGDDETYLVERCETCGLGRTLGAARLDPAVLHSSGSYSMGPPRLAGLAMPALTLFDRRRERMLRRAVGPGSNVLEVGAGRGRFLARLAAHGYAARGIEPSADRAEQARALGVEVTEAPVEETEVAPGSLDAVVAWHVLEHLRDPGAALDRIGGWLRPGGAILIGVPNRASLQAGVGGEHWFHLDVPRHVHHFTPDSLSRLLDAHGFDAGRYRHLLTEHNQFGMWQTAMNALTFHDNFLFGLLKRSLTPHTAKGRASFALDLLVTIFAALPALILTVPLEFAAGLARRGGTVAVVATRR